MTAVADVNVIPCAWCDVVAPRDTGLYVAVAGIVRHALNDHGKAPGDAYDALRPYVRCNRLRARGRIARLNPCDRALLDDGTCPKCPPPDGA